MIRETTKKVAILGVISAFAAILSYIDPLVAVLVSVLILSETISGWQVLGGILILGFTLWNEI